MTSTTSRTTRIFHRLRATWSDLDYAQRRLIENQAGLGRTADAHRSGDPRATRTF